MRSLRQRARRIAHFILDRRVFAKVADDAGFATPAHFIATFR